MRIEIKNLKKGMVVYECAFGQDVRLEVLENAYHIDDSKLKYGWECRVQPFMNGQKMTPLFLFVDSRNGTYGPKVYTEPQYDNVS